MFVTHSLDFLADLVDYLVKILDSPTISTNCEASCGACKARNLLLWLKDRAQIVTLGLIRQTRKLHTAGSVYLG